MANNLLKLYLCTHFQVEKATSSRAAPESAVLSRLVVNKVGFFLGFSGKKKFQKRSPTDNLYSNGQRTRAEETPKSPPLGTFTIKNTVNTGINRRKRFLERFLYFLELFYNPLYKMEFRPRA